MRRFSILVTAMFLVLLQACAGPAPEPQPGMEVVQYGHNGELQIADDVDLSSYTKVILNKAPVEFRKNWERDLQRIMSRPVREDDLERIKSGVSDQFSKVMYGALTGPGGYDVTGEVGEDVMLFSPNIVDLDVKNPGLEKGALTEGIVNTRGSMTIELVITDSESGKLLAAAWQEQSDPHEGDMESTASVNNTLAFRRMMESYASWLLEGLDKAK